MREKFKDRTRNHFPIIVAALSGAAIGATLVYRAYNPKNKVAIQLPKGVMTEMRETGKGLAINSNAGWFTLKYHPQD